MRNRLFRFLSTILLGAAVSITITGCKPTPYRAKTNFHWLVQAKFTIGKQQYGPSRQSQGGVYTINPSLNMMLSISDRNLLH
ncbi:MAG: hypothetical protein ACJATV_001097 [Granulosicoccus sp.]|jgi:hypothetical protein